MLASSIDAILDCAMRKSRVLSRHASLVAALQCAASISILSRRVETCHTTTRGARGDQDFPYIYLYTIYVLLYNINAAFRVHANNANSADLAGLSFIYVLCAQALNCASKWELAFAG